MENPSTITSFLVKIASRCNLNCDYCYVFNHADQSWRSMPPLMSESNRQTLAKRIGEYVTEKSLQNVLIVFHGGEPLLAGSKRIVETANWMRQNLSPEVKIDFSLQTNGVLLTREIIETLADAKIGISLSLDGPKVVNDLHRLTHKGKSTYDDTLRAYNLLKEYPEIFTGVISVIDAKIKPRELLEYFNFLNPPSFDFLLPDANYIKPPPYRNENPDIYLNWLIEAFDIWLDEFPELKIRLFDTLLATVMGGPSKTDFFGFGKVTMLSIETDGSYHDLDVLKITTEGRSSLGYNIHDHSINEVASCSQIAEHNRLLSREGISSVCKSCSVVEICGGGAVPHRYDNNGFENPTIYCKEMLGIITHAQKRLNDLLATSFVENSNDISCNRNIDIGAYNAAMEINEELNNVFQAWCQKSSQEFRDVLDYLLKLNPDFSTRYDYFKSLNDKEFTYISRLPSVKLWVRVMLSHREGITLFDLDQNPIPADFNYPEDISALWLNHNVEDIKIHPHDPWLRIPFGSKILFEDEDFALSTGQEIVKQSLEIIEAYNPALKKEITQLSPIILFIKDPSAHPDKLVSFSDNIVPGALYVCIQHSQGVASPYDIADSIIHEHRHQKLYLLEEYSSVVTSNTPFVPSPWREELRPVSGLFHAVFVFHELEKFWRYLVKKPEKILSQKAHHETQKNQRMLKEAFITLETCALTDIGRNFLSLFTKEIEHVQSLPSE